MSQRVTQAIDTALKETGLEHLFAPRPFVMPAAPVKKAKAKAKPVDSAWRERYAAAHLENFKIKFPTAFKDGFYTPPTYPKVNTANGLTKAITNYVDWVGGVGNRIKSEGRLIQSAETLHGQKFESKKYVKSTTKKGTADTDLQLPNGKNLKVEVKVGKDAPSDDQLRMQRRVRAAGGLYEFIGDMIQFYEVYDRIVNPELFI